jgi:hypothetical protein
MTYLSRIQVRRPTPTRKVALLARPLFHGYCLCRSAAMAHGAAVPPNYPPGEDRAHRARMRDNAIAGLSSGERNGFVELIAATRVPITGLS